VPRIRRWHPVSHDLVRDREVQELRREFADWMGYVWLEMLSESDRNQGRVKGDKESIAKSLAWVSLSERPSRHAYKIVSALSYMVQKGWIEESEGCYLVCNYPDYHPRREQASSREGSKQVPVGIVSTSPSLKPSNGFEEFWERYPQQEGKGKAEESWGKHTRGVQLEEILAGLEKWQGSQKWADGFITLPATWLNQKRWKDNPRQAKSRSQAKLLWDQAQAEKEKKE